MEQTTEDGITVGEIDAAYKVLETLRENLSDDGMNNLSEICNEAHYLVQQYDEGASWKPRYDLPEPGDVLNDPESVIRFGSGDVKVVEVTDKPANSEYVDSAHGEQSIASLNPDHPADAPIVRATYVDGSDKVYAFPCTRLEETDE